ncbi:hypothetical protein BDV59DRAFT_187989 [Aspergillus ambiguus]|uniref:uncharacterized protein n=1 Tax=Aspergillus ambiguus TaxID=176160 RepID=UPI003CCD0CAA
MIPILYLLFGAALALDRTTSIVAGVAEYTGVAVDVYNPLPTLIYNCYNLKSICKNVEEYLDDNNLVMGTGLDFHYDSLSTSTDRRRRQSCPSKTWTNVLPFPCGSDPAQPSVMPGNLPARVGPLPGWQNPDFKMEIPNLLGTGPSGMRYTCDEFPAASWIEGGVNNQPPYTSVYCAPKQVSCEGETWKRVFAANPLYPHTASEQDWQADAHSLLGGYAKRRSTSNSGVVMKFHFTTTNLGVGSAATAAQVVMPSFANNPDTTEVANAKRDEIKQVESRFHCTGAFCEELKKAGFDFEVPPPSPSFQLLKSDSGTASDSESPHATFHILTF